MPGKQRPPRKVKDTAKSERGASPKRQRQPKKAKDSAKLEGGFEMPTKQVGSQQPGLQDRELQERLANADLVVVGKVSAIKALPEAETRRGGSYKDPLLQMATINVESVEKGSLTQKSVDVIYASSRDISWYRSWKPELGQQGIWFLQAPQKQGVGMLSVAQAPGTYGALQPGDYQPKDQLDRVRSLNK